MAGYDTWLTPREKVGSFEVRCEKTTAVCGNCGFKSTRGADIKLAGPGHGHTCPKCNQGDFWADQCGHVFMAECHWQEPGSVELLRPDRCPECGADDCFEVSDDDPGPDPDAQRDQMEDR